MKLSNSVIIGIAAIIAGVLVIVWPEFIRWIVGIFLIVWGALTIFGKN